MKFLKKLITSFFVLFFFLSGAFLIHCSANAPEYLVQIKSFFRPSDASFLFGAGVVGIIFVVISLIFLYAGTKVNQKKKYIAFDNPNGEVTISISAIEDFLKKVGNEFTEIKEIQSKIIAKGRSVKLRTKISLWETDNIPEVIEKIQSEIKTQVQSILGVENISGVEVNIDKIIQRENSPLHSIPNQTPYLTEG